MRHELTGPLAATLYMSTTTTDADIFVTLRAFLADGSEVVFDGPSEIPPPPLAQGCLRLSHRRTDPARSTPWQPFHPHNRAEPAQPGQVYRVDVGLWPTSIILPTGATLAVTISGRDFARGITHPTIDPGELTGRGSGTFLHCDATDRPAPTFARQTTIHIGGTTPRPPPHPDHPGRNAGRIPGQAIASRF